MRPKKAIPARPFLDALATFLLVFIIAELLRLPPRAAIALSALAAIGMVYRRPILAFGRSVLTKSATPPALGVVLAQSEAEIRRLRLVQTESQAEAIASIVGSIADAAETIVAQARQGALEPRLGARVLSYYLPRAADLAEAWPALDGDAERRGNAQRLLARLAQLLQATARGQSDDALRALDVDMRLLDQALQDDRADRA